MEAWKASLKIQFMYQDDVRMLGMKKPSFISNATNWGGIIYMSTQVHVYCRLHQNFERTAQQ